jgi:hypothetical protein
VVSRPLASGLEGDNSKFPLAALDTDTLRNDTAIK